MLKGSRTPSGAWYATSVRNVLARGHDGPAGEAILALVGQFLIIAKLEDHDIRAPILGMGRVVAIYRCIPILFKTTSDLHDLQRVFCWLRCSIRSTAWESRLMRDALTIVVVHISRQQYQPLLNVGQQFGLKAGPDFLQRVNKPGHFVGPDPPIQRKPIEPGHFSPRPGKRIQRHRKKRSPRGSYRCHMDYPISATSMSVWSSTQAYPVSFRQE